MGELSEQVAELESELEDVKTDLYEANEEIQRLEEELDKPPDLSEIKNALIKLINHQHWLAKNMNHMFTVGDVITLIERYEP